MAPPTLEELTGRHFPKEPAPADYVHDLTQDGTKLLDQEKSCADLAGADFLTNGNLLDLVHVIGIQGSDGKEEIVLSAINDDGRDEFHPPLGKTALGFDKNSWYDTLYSTQRFAYRVPQPGVVNPEDHPKEHLKICRAGTGNNIQAYAYRTNDILDRTRDEVKQNCGLFSSRTRPRLILDTKDFVTLFHGASLTVGEYYPKPVGREGKRYQLVVSATNIPQVQYMIDQIDSGTISIGKTVTKTIIAGQETTNSVALGLLEAIRPELEDRARAAASQDLALKQFEQAVKQFEQQLAVMAQQFWIGIGVGVLTTGLMLFMQWRTTVRMERFQEKQRIESQDFHREMQREVTNRMEKFQREMLEKQMGGQPENPAEALEKYTENWTQMAREGRIPKLYGRDAEVLAAMELLAAGKPLDMNNLGVTAKETDGKQGAGVGKSALLKEIARRIAINDSTVPPRLRGVDILAVDEKKIRGGDVTKEGSASVAGVYEKRGMQITEGAKQAAKPTLLVWEESASLFNSHAQGVDPLIKQMLPDLEKKDPVLKGDTYVEYSVTDRPDKNPRLRLSAPGGKFLPGGGHIEIYDANQKLIHTMSISADTSLVEDVEVARSEKNFYVIVVKDKQGQVVNRPNHWFGNVFILTAQERRDTFGSIKWSNASRRVGTWIELAEMSPDQTFDMFQAARADYATKYRMTITDEAFQEAIRLGEEFQPELSNPAKAIVILQAAAGRLEDKIQQLEARHVGEIFAESKGMSYASMLKARAARARVKVRDAVRLAEIQHQSVLVFLQQVSGVETDWFVSSILDEWRRLGREESGYAAFWIEGARRRERYQEGMVPFEFIEDYLDQHKGVGSNRIVQDHVATIIHTEHPQLKNSRYGSVVDRMIEAIIRDWNRNGKSDADVVNQVSCPSRALVLSGVERMLLEEAQKTEELLAVLRNKSDKKDDKDSLKKNLDHSREAGKSVGI